MRRHSSRSALRVLFIPLVIVLLAGCSLGQIIPAYFGMQCGVGNVPGADNCSAPQGSEVPTWPTSVAQPGLLRLWDSQVGWSWLMTGYSGGVGTYDWTQLDGYLDVIAQHQLVDVNYVFGCVPVFAMPTGTAPGPKGSCGSSGGAAPPTDLSSSGSATFNQFVTDLVNHCSPAGNCVKTLVTGYELWNEANVCNLTSQFPTPRWCGTQTQLYQMLAPGVAIIKRNVSGARIYTPSITSGTQAATWMEGWLQAEVAGGIISGYYNIHEYLNNDIPENRLSLATIDLVPNNPGTVTGWKTLPWIMGETGYDDVNFPYSCNAQQNVPLFTTDDCIGQMVRWDLLLFSNAGSWPSGGAVGLYWYYWNTYIGSDPPYAIAYKNMMQYLQGGSFSAPCSPSTTVGIQTWTCKFSEQNGTAALWVWTPTETGTTYSIPNGYSDYRDLTGTTTPVSPGQSVNISVQPLMLEGTTAPTHLTATVR